MDSKVNKAIRPIFSSLINSYNYILSSFSDGSITSPIKFSDGTFNLTIQEYLNIEDMPKEVQQNYFKFRYSKNPVIRSNEERYDSLYYKNSSVFVVFDRYNQVVGSQLIVVKNDNQKLPIEFSKYSDKTDGNKGLFKLKKTPKNRKIVEIYALKCERSPKIDKRMIPDIVNMLFKAVWAKSVQLKIKYIYLTCSVTKGLQNLYLNRLSFDGPTINITYDGKTTYKALRKDCDFHEAQFASISKKHFKTQLYFRKGLKKQFLHNPLLLVLITSIIKNFFYFTRLFKYRKNDRKIPIIHTRQKINTLQKRKIFSNKMKEKMPSNT